MDPEALKPASAQAPYAQHEGMKPSLALKDDVEASIVDQKESLRDMKEKSRTWFDGKEPSTENVDEFAEYLVSSIDKEQAKMNAACNKMKAVVKETKPDSCKYPPTEEGSAKYKADVTKWQESGQAASEATTTWSGFFQEIADRIQDLLDELGQLLRPLTAVLLS